jgi:SAM-dependent methyltransferase
VFGGIPDLRLDAPAWVEPEADRERARSLLTLPADSPASELAYRVFRRREGWSEREARYRSAQVAALAPRAERDFDGWLRPTVSVGGPVVDLGCGAGGLLAALVRRGVQGVGIDVSLEWLVVAHRIIVENGGRPLLAAAMAESLPLADASVRAVISLDVLEHVGDQRRYIQEVDRVLQPGGVCALATPNRFSLTPEPHVAVWGVGWLPRRWQRSYVWWRAAKRYEFCTLLSVLGLRRVVSVNTSLRPQIAPGIVPDDELRRFPAPRARLARLYNRVAARAGLKVVVLPVCPFFRVIARKAAP